MSRILGLLALLGISGVTFAVPPPGGYCAAPEFHQLDFWIGDWDTVDLSDHPDGKGPSIAHARVEPVLDGCALHERYEQSDGLVGESYTLYVVSRKIWHQSWVNNGANLWLQDGDFKDGVLTMTATTIGKDGRPIMHRITWNQQGAGVRETSHASTDGGKTWGDEFDVLFVKRGTAERGG